MSASAADDALIIRLFAPADQEAAQRLVLDGLAQHFGYLDQSLNRDLDDIKAHYIDQGNLFVVAVVDNRVVGTGGLLFIDRQRGQIVRISVTKDLRRRGIGRALVDNLVDKCRERNLQAVNVETSLAWTGAALFYRCYGFFEHSRDSESIYLQLSLKA